MTERRQCILIVDDNPTNIQVLNEVLGDDYEILFATNGKDGIHIAREEQPDLILLDIMMPEMDGYHVCRELKESLRTKDIPVIFVTAMSEAEDETNGLEMGAVDYIIKPINPPIVKARVRNHLELKRQRDLLRNLSNIDGLTGIPNRRRLDELLEQEWARAARNQTPLSVMMIDIDFFKQFNDHYGHLAGDDCLKAIAQLLATSARRPADFVARYGGEEFVCILPDTDYVGAKALAEQVRKNVEMLAIPHQSSQVAEVVTVSIGVASVAAPHEDTPNGLIKAADAKLYEAKRKGRNRIAGKQLAA